MARLLPFISFWDLWSGALTSGSFSLLLVRISRLVHMPWRRLCRAMGRFNQECPWAEGWTSLMQLFLSFILFNCCEALIVFISPIP